VRGGLDKGWEVKWKGRKYEYRETFVEKFR